MKKMIAIVLMLTLLTGCTKQDPTYPFPNRDVEIVSVELLHNMNVNCICIDESKLVLLRTLDEDEIVEFMNACYQLQTKDMGTPPNSGYGEYVARITYVNGDIEIYSTYNIELIPAGKEAQGCGTHYFPVRIFDEVFAQYVDISKLPEPPRT